MSQRTPVSVDSDKPLSAKQLRIVDHILTTGETVIQASATLNMDPSNIYRMLRYPHVKKYLYERTLDHIGILAPIAAKAQQELLRSDSDHVRANVAENILDRHLGKPVTRSQVAVQGSINVTIDLG